MAKPQKLKPGLSADELAWYRSLIVDVYGEDAAQAKIEAIEEEYSINEEAAIMMVVKGEKLDKDKHFPSQTDVMRAQKKTAVAKTPASPSPPKQYALNREAEGFTPPRITIKKKDLAALQNKFGQRGYEWKPAEDDPKLANLFQEILANNLDPAMADELGSFAWDEKGYWRVYIVQIPQQPKVTVLDRFPPTIYSCMVYLGEGVAAFLRIKDEDTKDYYESHAGCIGAVMGAYKNKKKTSEDVGEKVWNEINVCGLIIAEEDDDDDDEVVV